MEAYGAGPWNRMEEEEEMSEIHSLFPRIWATGGHMKATGMTHRSSQLHPTQ